MYQSFKNRVFFTTLFLACMSGIIVMSYEIITARMIAPLLGSSIYTWTAAIGMVLAGATVGVLIGGWASKNDYFLLLPFSYLVATVTIGGAFILQPVMRACIAQSSLSLPMLALCIAGMFAFVQTLALSFAGPLFIELITYSLDTIGPRYSMLSIAGSLGSIAGVFLGGFVFVPLFGIPTSIMIITLLCIVMAILSITLLLEKRHRHITASITGIIILIMLFFFIKPILGTNHALAQYESPYYHIHVYDTPFQNIEDARWLFLDFDSHSVDTHGEKLGVYTDTAYIIPDMLAHAQITSPEILVLGAGAYTIPKILAKKFPTQPINVIEIDPTLESIGKTFFDLNTYTNISTLVGDPRYILPKQEKTYDVIFNDIYNSFISVPSHLVTIEFLHEVKKRLDPNGLYFMSFIATEDSAGHKVAQHMVATAQEVFGDVRVLFFGATDQSIDSFVIIASPTTITSSETELETFIKKEIPHAHHINFVTVETTDMRPFTDDWQPLDTLMRPLLKKYFSAYKDVYYRITQ